MVDLYSLQISQQKSLRILNESDLMKQLKLFGMFQCYNCKTELHLGDWGLSQRASNKSKPKVRCVDCAIELGFIAKESIPKNIWREIKNGR